MVEKVIGPTEFRRKINAGVIVSDFVKIELQPNGEAEVRHNGSSVTHISRFYAGTESRAKIILGIRDDEQKNMEKNA